QSRNRLRLRVGFEPPRVVAKTMAPIAPRPKRQASTITMTLPEPEPELELDPDELLSSLLLGVESLLPEVEELPDDAGGFGFTAGGLLVGGVGVLPVPLPAGGAFGAASAATLKAMLFLVRNDFTSLASMK